jgi:hypothetical protein
LINIKSLLKKRSNKNENDKKIDNESKAITSNSVSKTIPKETNNQVINNATITKTKKGNKNRKAIASKSNKNDDSEFEFGASVKKKNNQEPVESFQIYLNESCCVEICATKENSLAYNILIQVIFYDF